MSKKAQRWFIESKNNFTTEVLVQILDISPEERMEQKRTNQNKKIYVWEISEKDLKDLEERKKEPNWNLSYETYAMMEECGKLYPKKYGEPLKERKKDKELKRAQKFAKEAKAKKREKAKKTILKMEFVLS